MTVEVCGREARVHGRCDKRIKGCFYYRNSLAPRATSSAARGPPPHRAQLRGTGIKQKLKINKHLETIVHASISPPSEVYPGPFSKLGVRHWGSELFEDSVPHVSELLSFLEWT